MAAGTVSVMGSWMQAAAQSWVVLRLTGSSAALGLSVSLQALPSLLLGLWGGVLADRLPRRRLLVVTQSAHASLAFLLAMLMATGHLSVGLLMVTALIAGLISATEGPASGALSAELVDPEDLQSALALGSITYSLGRIVGMAAAGVVLSWVGPSAAFALNGLSFLPVVFVLCTLPAGIAARRARAETSAWSDLVEGMRLVRRHPTLLLTFLVAFTLGAFGRNYQVTMAVMSSDVFGRGAAGYALLSTVFALGALGGGIAAAHWGRSRLRYVLGVGASGACLQLLSSGTPSFVSFAVLIALIGAFAVMFDTGVSAHVQTAVPSEYRGRINGAAMATGAAAGVFGAPVLGALAQILGARAALAIGALICLTAVGVAAYRQLARTSWRDALAAVWPRPVFDAEPS
jgi:MFS family permease